MDLHLEAVSKVTVPLLLQRKARSQKITCLTAYDYPTALLVDEAGIDVVLVGDTLGQVVLGYESTLPVTVEEILHHLSAVARGIKRALLVADLPYGSYQVNCEDALYASIRFLKEGKAEAVKLEGGKKRADLIRRLVDAEIPVMGHIGLTPQSVHVFGGHRVQGKTASAASQILEDAQAIEDAGAFAVVLEGMPRELAELITRRLRIPTIGIGAGPGCDGQILVLHDLLGLTPGPVPKFVRPYAALAESIRTVLRQYDDDVRTGRYPCDAESYHWPQNVRSQIEEDGGGATSRDPYPHSLTAQP
jgi:3-methyl-2-oxobutanoate hydroxymethyltransferase